MKHVLMFSGGIGSYAAGRKLYLAGLRPALLFADTLVEDQDTYRFLVEAAARLTGVPRSVWGGLASLWEGLPPLADMPRRKLHLRNLAEAARLALPDLHWVADGRTPWEVFTKERFLGNSRIAKCSHVLKQDVCRRWLRDNRSAADTTLHVGIHWSERERFDGQGAKPGIRQLWAPWTCSAPLCEPPLGAYQAMFADLAADGIARPLLYDLGATHNNCSGGCVKAGHASWANTLDKLPEVYAYNEAEEQKLRGYLDKDVAILRDRRGGQTRPLTLVEFRGRREGGSSCDPTDVGGCGCFTSDPDEKE